MLHSVSKRAWIAAGVVAVGAVAAAVVVLTRGDASVAATMRAAGCSYADVVPYPPKDAATLADYHADVPTLTTKVRWATFPPSGGSHYRLWATWGFYTKPVNPRMVVHNEEHGGVIVWWGPKVPRSTVAELRRFYDSQPVAVFGTPIAGLGDKLALTAWTADPAYKGDAGARLPATATTGSGASRCARASTRRRSRRSATPTGARARRPSRSPPTARAAARRRAAAASQTPEPVTTR